MTLREKALLAYDERLREEAMRAEVERQFLRRLLREMVSGFAEGIDFDLRWNDLNSEAWTSESNIRQIQKFCGFWSAVFDGIWIVVVDGNSGSSMAVFLYCHSCSDGITLPFRDLAQLGDILTHLEPSDAVCNRCKEREDANCFIAN